MSIDKLLNANMEFRQEVEKLKEQLTQTKELLNSKNEELEKVKNELNKKKTLTKEEFEEVENIKKENIELKSLIIATDNKIKELNSIINAKEEESDKIKEELAILSTQIRSQESINTTILELETKIKEFESINIEKEKIISSKNQLIQDKEKIIEEQNKEIELIKNQLENLQHRKSATKNVNLHRGRVRACIKCSEYVFLHLNDPENQKVIKQFELNHKGHTIITVDLSEVKDRYRNIELIEDSEQ
ncbi:MAG: hypothetical protein JXA99_11290 [Candidatus Lokiarchaeota archaeon]|nr:hypothetical protein [Candidatus Lokiarchaeota archaeon]